MSSDPSLHHLRGRLRSVTDRVRALVDARRAETDGEDDPYAGLYVSDEQVETLLATPIAPVPALGEGPGSPQDPSHQAVEAAATQAERDGSTVRLRELARNFGLDGLDVEILLIAAAPEYDARYERLYGYLNDDVTRRRATIGLILELLGLPALSSAARARFAPTSALRRGTLIVLEGDAERGLLTRHVRVPERVLAHLLGDDTPDPLVAPLIEQVVEVEWPVVEPLAAALSGGSAPIYITDHVGAAVQSVAATAMRAATGQSALVIDLSRLGVREEVADTIASALRDTLLRGGGIVAGPLEELQRLDRAALRVLVEADVPRVLSGSGGWDPTWGRAVPLVIDGPVPSLQEREALWNRTIDVLVHEGREVALDAAAATVAFRLTPEQIERASRAGAIIADSEGRALQDADLRRGARAQNAVGLERLATRIEPRATWDDLVVGDHLLQGLKELAARSRYRDRVLGEWGLGSRTGRGRGVTGLFAGESGTGKTMSAEVVAGDLGLDLYVIDLSTVVDKYIGETEKNLDRVFAQADRVNGVLLFDEADALFGKRSEVSDAHDRHANVEVAYLLQRMEQFDGIALLTTNLRANIDEAFTRRLDAILEFAVPDVEERRRLWMKNLTGRLPLSDDVDLDFLAKQFRMVGGEIRNIAVTAAYLAASRDTDVRMVDLIDATAREYRKLGRLTVAEEFGDHLERLTTTGGRDGT